MKITLRNNSARIPRAVHGGEFPPCKDFLFDALPCRRGGHLLLKNNKKCKIAKGYYKYQSKSGIIINNRVCYRYLLIYRLIDNIDRISWRYYYPNMQN